MEWGIEQPAEAWKPVISARNSGESGGIPGTIHRRFRSGMQLRACGRRRSAGLFRCSLPRLGDIAMHAKAATWTRDFFGLERVISFITDPFPWPEVEAFAGADRHLPEFPLACPAEESAGRLMIRSNSSTTRRCGKPPRIEPITRWRTGRRCARSRPRYSHSRRWPPRTAVAFGKDRSPIHTRRWASSKTHSANLCMPKAGGRCWT